MKNNVIDVESAGFDSDVVQASYNQPVVVDFWAPWCGPCRMLGPLLERLANEPDSGFILAKVNTDQNPDLSGRYSIRGIPAVKAFRNGRIVDEFVGAQPEANVRQFLTRVKATGSAVPKATVTAPESPAEALQLARDYLKKGRGCDAEQLLAGLKNKLQAEDAATLMPLAQFLCRAASGRSPLGMGANDDEARRAATAWGKEPSAALYTLLTLLNQTSGEERSAVQAVLESALASLGDSDPLTIQYRTFIA